MLSRGLFHRVQKILYLQSGNQKQQTMKILKIIGVVLLGLVLIVIIASFIVTTDFKYEKKVTINAPIETVWENTNSLADLDAWSPWVEKDPNIKKKYTGVDGTVGAVSSWESDHEEVGVGSQTITKIEAPTTFDTDLKFYTPYESEAKGYIRLAAAGNKTEVVWGFASEMPRPFNLMLLNPAMNDMMDKEFARGLENLAKLCE
jgi:hypothetical protein